MNDLSIFRSPNRARLAPLILALAWTAATVHGLPVTNDRVVPEAATTVLERHAPSATSETPVPFLPSKADTTIERSALSPPPEDCSNGIDDDGDGLIDCADPDCSGYVACYCTFPEPLVWLRADMGWSAATWTDQTSNGRNGTNGGNPFLLPDALNFNPAVVYDGNDLTHCNVPELVWLSGNHHLTIFAVYKPANNNTNMGVFGNQGNGGSNNTMLYNGIIGDGAGPAPDYPVPGLYGAKVHMLSYIVDEEDNISGIPSSSAAYNKGVLQTTLFYNENNIGQIITDMYIGKSGTNPISQFFTGEIAEFILFERSTGTASLSSVDRERVQSYLAIKYGLTLPHSYYRPNGSVAWNMAANSGYGDRITIIGREDCHPMDQRRSLSMETGGLITVSHTSFGGSPSVPDAFPNNGDHFGFGDDNGPLTVSAAFGANSNMKLGRDWKVEEHGTVGQVTLGMPKSAVPPGLTHMIVFADPAQPHVGAVLVPLFDTGSRWRVAHDFASGDHFSFIRDPFTATTGPMDLDDDDDGIPDAIESEDNVTGAFAWNMNTPVGTIQVDEVSDPRITAWALNSTGDLIVNGLTATTSTTTVQIDVMPAATLAQALTNGDYVEVTFTTGSNVSYIQLDRLRSGWYTPSQGDSYFSTTLVGTAPYSVWDTLSKDVLHTDDGSSYAMFEHKDASPRMLLPGQEYKVRSYCYGQINDSPQNYSILDDLRFYITAGLAQDTDGDGVPDHLDLDSDNDGIYDLVEAGHGMADVDLNGVIDGVPADQGANGLFDALETFPDSGILNYVVSDSDADGHIDSTELDADNDGCFDVIEAGFIDHNGDGELGNVPLTVDASGVVTSTLP